MVRVIFYLTVFLGCICNAQVQCPTISSPQNGDTDVAVDAEISWTRISGIDGYSVSLGTTEGASDILNSRSAALVNSLVPFVGLPDDTEVFVTIGLFLDNGTFITCPSESFRTVDVTSPPDCTNLNNPLANAENVRISEILRWDYAPTATGYRISIGTSENGSEILEETNVGNVLDYRLPENLPPNTEVYVRIIPFNENGDAQSCSVERFTTGDNSINCESFTPEIDIPESIGLCPGASEITLVSEDRADGYRWFKLNSDETEVLLSETNTVVLSEIGAYRYEAYIVVSLFGETAECVSTQNFSVVASQMAIVESINVIKAGSEINLEVFVTGTGDYEYSLDNIDGPYQDNNTFLSVSEGNHLIYIRDKNGCGITEYPFIQIVTTDDFPKFFTPNSDGVNDYWQFSPLNESIASLDTIYIYDRYGKLLYQLNPESAGWDGTFNGKALHSSTYWYKAVSLNGRAIQGYFALKR